ncbi:cytochrome P450 [Desertimonas flava]|uniref:cytochrome P450 n=1 Tax=Desertimonas flava TaxID=2064846 RepID=UPI0019692898|nr:cytochrome P450 [Desertimonas flava]
MGDWATDFDIFDPEYVQHPFAIWDELRQVCPVAQSARWGGSYLLTTHADVLSTAHDVDRFSSSSVLVVPVPFTYDEHGNRSRPVINADPPEHGPERRLMLPFFTRLAAERYREPTREMCRRLLLQFVDDETVDVAQDYARQIPTRVIADILGLDPERGEEFTEWVRGALELGLMDSEILRRSREAVESFLDREIERRREEPGDDLISFLLTAEIHGQSMPLHVLRSTLSLMLVAGIDTTWSAIGAALWHLARHSQDRRRLVAEPELIPVAVEEFLRAYSPVTMARVARADATVGTTHVEAGARILLNFPAANRDPAVFDRPDEVIVDRGVNPHIAFGTGIHRCLGANLARMEMQVAIEEFLGAIPEFELSDPAAVAWTGGQVRGPRHVPVRILERPGRP